MPIAFVTVKVPDGGLVHLDVDYMGNDGGLPRDLGWVFFHGWAVYVCLDILKELVDLLNKLIDNRS